MHLLNLIRRYSFLFSPHAIKMLLLISHDAVPHYTAPNKGRLEGEAMVEDVGKRLRQFPFHWEPDSRGECD